MRPVSMTDLMLLTRAVLRVPPEERGRWLAQRLQEVHWADLYRKRLGRAHPVWGNGALSARALQMPLADAPWLSAPVVGALAQVVGALAAWRARGL